MTGLASYGGEVAPLRIALVHNLRPGGAWRTTYEHQLRLQGEILEFCLRSATPLSADAQVVPFARTAERLHPSLRPLPRHLDLVALVLAWRRLARAVDSAECDVVLAHPCQYLQAPLALRWVGPRSVYFCRRASPGRLRGRRGGDGESAHSSPLRRPASRRTQVGSTRVASASTLLTNSRFTATRIQAAYRRHAEPVALGVAEVFRAPGAPVPRAHLLSVGSLVAGKGHDLAIEVAAKTTRQLPLILVANRPRTQEISRLRKLAERLAVELDIRIGISDEELRALYSGAVATLYLAAEEPLGLASLEAQACGSPVVVSDEGGLPETLLSGETGWTVRREHTAEAARLLDALEDPALMQRVSRAARAHGSAQTWAQSSAHVQRVIEQVSGR